MKNVSYARSFQTTVLRKYLYVCGNVTDKETPLIQTDIEKENQCEQK